MSVVLTPRNKALEPFRIRNSGWSAIFEAGGLIWPMLSAFGHWVVVDGIDPRFAADESNSLYPDILGDSGRSFRVTAAEARHLAHCARNLAALQSVLMARKAVGDDIPPHVPTYHPDDIPVWEAFADWAEQSRGFVK